MNFYDQFAEWLFNPERAPLQKTAVILSIIVSVFIINEVTGFTFYYNTQQKVDQLSKLTDVIKDPATDSSSRLQAIMLKNEIHEREPFLVLFRNRLKGNFPSSHDIYHSMYAIPKTTSTLPQVISIEDDFWFFVSIAGIYLIFIPVHFLMTFFFLKKYMKLEDAVMVYFVLYFIMLLAVAVLYYLLSYIASTFDNPDWNYAFNLSVQFITFHFIIRNFRKAQKQKRR